MKKFGLLQSLMFVFLILATTAIVSRAQTITTLTNFNGIDGSYPLAALVQGSDGNFYGTTSEGGTNDPFGPGTVFEITPGGALTTLHNFDGNDGDLPQVTLVHATDGDFYGTTWQGGASNYGTIFKITAAGTFTLLHSFTGGTDGRYPGPLIQASDGNFYGTAWGGGNNNCESTGGCGVIFKISPQGNFTKIYQFLGDSNDGYGPVGLVQGRDGNFYGMSIGFSQVLCSSLCGSVFKVTPAGNFTILHWFNGQDGNYPLGQLLQATDGNFYGTTSEGGAHTSGTVFKITPSGAFTLLYSFCHEPQDNCPDGATPVSGLMQAMDGTLFGTTTNGGTYGYEPFGTIFKITTSGNLTTLFSFNNASNGGSPAARLLQATNGDFFGLTSGGGANYYGTFFQFYATGKTLSVSTSGNGTVTSTDGIISCPGGACSHIYPNNTQVTLNATAAEGWAFVGWGGACGGTGACQVDMTQDQSVTASFLPFYTLSVNITGSGRVSSTDGFINCPGVCSHVYVSNSLVTLNASPAQGWSLSSWGGLECYGTDTCTVQVSQNQTVNVTFIQDYYTLTASMSGSGTITSTDGFINCPGTCSHTYLSLTAVTLNAAPAQGWNFSGWSGACNGVGPCNVNMTGNLGVSAYFMQPGSGLQFSSMTPCRLVDTRQTGNPLQGGIAQNYAIPQLGNCNVPSTATAYSLNVTVVPHGGLGYLTIWPAGLAQPTISTMNSLDGRIKANAAIVPAGASGAISVFASNTTDLVLDIDGYFEPASGQTLQFYALKPCRVLDTRKTDGDLGGPYLPSGQERDFPVLESNCQIPNTAQAYSMNFTVVPYNGELMGYLTVWAQGSSKPVVSTLNNLTATIVANAAIVPAGTDGGIAVYPSGNTQLVADIDGYFAPPGQTGLLLYPAPPCRVIDTRKGNGAFSGELTVDVVDSVCAPPSTAQAYVLNATVVPIGSLGYLTLWPDTETQPLASTLNAVDGAITSNMAIVPNVNGSTDAFASGPTQLILDIASYFAP